jgi:hypothetical protein
MLNRIETASLEEGSCKASIDFIRRRDQAQQVVGA